MRDLECDPNSSIYSISIVKRVLEIVIDELKATGSSLITLVIDSLDSKKGARERELFATVCLWMNLIENKPRHASVSTNTSALRGIKVKRNGRVQSWKIGKTFTDDKYLDILASVLEKVDTDSAREITKIFEFKKLSIYEKKEKLKLYVLSSNIKESGSFTLKPTKQPTAATDYFSPIKEDDDISTSIEFNYERFDRNHAQLSSQRVRLSVCLSQKRALLLMFNSFVDNSMTGLISDRGNIEYAMKMCSVLNTILDSSKLREKIEKMRGAKEDDEEECDDEGSEVGAGDEGGETEEDEVALDLSNSNVLRNVLYEEIESERERVVYDHGESAKKKKNSSIRIRNALSAMGLIGRLMKHTKYQVLGDHVGEQYANKFLKVKFETEIKSFLTQLNSPTKYAL